MRLKEKERPRGLLVWLALQVAFIYIYISLDDSHRFITVVYEKYPHKTYIPTFRLNEKRIIFVGQVFSTHSRIRRSSRLRPLSFLINPKPES